jgi:hypothetical protein
MKVRVRVPEKLMIHKLVIPETIICVVPCTHLMMWIDSAPMHEVIIEGETAVAEEDKLEVEVSWRYFMRFSPA